jgi:argininosuccinate lyase
VIAKTAAAGGATLHPELLAFSSSLALDKALIKEDLLGSLAHLTMLARQGIIPRGAAESLRQGLIALWAQAAEGALSLPEEEDVHMAVEAALAASVGAPAGLLHTARSRNDQVALDLKLHVREQCAEIRAALGRWVALLVERAGAEAEVLLPAYTHRQRAQPVSLAYWLASYAAMFARDIEAFTFAYGQADALPLGVGAIAGTSLPIDRELSRALLGFSRTSLNGMDTVGDRDFALDYSYAAARLMLHASRFAADLVDFSSAEFGFATLDDEIACGSSMMPQKKNPDVFELIRGKSGRGIGNLVSLLVTVKGLPAGYNRDLQEDRAPLLETGPLVRSVLSILGLALPRVRFSKERCLAALRSDATQATDLAEALVQKGVPFRVAYQAVGQLVRRCQERGVPLAAATPALAGDIHPALDEEALLAVRVEASVGRKISAGSTGPEPVERQLAALRQAAEDALSTAAALPRLSSLFSSLKEAPL